MKKLIALLVSLSFMFGGFSIATAEEAAGTGAAAAVTTPVKGEAKQVKVKAAKKAKKAKKEWKKADKKMEVTTPVAK